MLPAFDAPRNTVENHRLAAADLEIANFENRVLLSLHAWTFLSIQSRRQNNCEPQRSLPSCFESGFMFKTGRYDVA